MQVRACDTAALQRSGPRRACQEDVPYMILTCRASLIEWPDFSDSFIVNQFKTGEMEGFILDDEEGYRCCLIVSQEGRAAAFQAFLRTAEDKTGFRKDAVTLLKFTLQVLKDRGVGKIWAHVAHKNPKAEKLLRFYQALGFRPSSSMIELEM